MMAVVGGGREIGGPHTLGFDERARPARGRKESED